MATAGISEEGGNDTRLSFGLHKEDVKQNVVISEKYRKTIVAKDSNTTN